MKKIKLLAAFILLFANVQIALGAEPVSKSRWSGVAIGGHDSTAYHDLQPQSDPQQKALTGKKAFVVEYKGAKWRFLSKESSEMFAADPERYSPAYNGHCANALSLGEGLVTTNGKTWEIFEDQLYLFYAPKGRVRWSDGNWKTYKVASDAAWEKLGANK